MYPPFIAEGFSYLAVGIAFILFRTYARIQHVGIKNLYIDDYFMLWTIAPYTTEIVLSYVAGYTFHGLSNSGMTNVERETISPESAEYRSRVAGSKIHICGWCTYVTVIWSIKVSLCAFYARLTVCRAELFPELS